MADVAWKLNIRRTAHAGGQPIFHQCHELDSTGLAVQAVLSGARAAVNPHEHLLSSTVHAHSYCTILAEPAVPVVLY